MAKGTRGRAPLPRATRSLDAIFRPRSVAVVGASRREHAIGWEILKNLVDYGFRGPVYPVNPAADSVRSMRCYPRLAAVPGPVDLAVIVVPRDEVLSVVRECARKKVRGLVVITAGFREAGGEGARLEARLQRLVRRHGMRMVGPNCMGVINTEADVRLNATFAATWPAPGNVGFVSQSGALGEAILADAASRALGVAMFVSMGNKTDISGNDLLEYWEADPRVGVILMYLESFGNPRKFIQIARRVTRRKPVITVKAGRTAAGARAATSHTGAMVGPDIATESLLEQAGVLRVSTMEELFVHATALANQPVPTGNRVAIVTNAGGPGILCTDACVGRGLELAPLAPATQRALRAVLPPEASVTNPVDMIASADAARYRAVLERVKADPNVDALIAIFVSPIMIDAYEVARAIAEAADNVKPVLSVFMGKQRSEEGMEELRRHRVPVYSFPEDAAAALAGMVRYRELRDAPRGRIVRLGADRAAARRILRAARREGRHQLAPEEVFRLLEAYGFPVVPWRVVTGAAEAIAASLELGYPVVLKIAAGNVVHKTDVGGVKLDLRTADEVGAAYQQLQRAFGGGGRPVRVLVQKLVSSGREVILGMTRDPRVGPLLLFGLGGVFVEVMRDVAVRVHPLTDVDARAMVRRVRGLPLLAGQRGEPPVDLQLIETALLRLSQLVSDFENEFEELDINPFIVSHRREQSFVVDGRVRLAPPPARARAVSAARGTTAA